VLESVAVLGLCTLAFKQFDLEHLSLLLDRAQELGETTHQPDVLARVNWLWGDLAFLSGEQAAWLESYTEALTCAAQTNDTLLAATLERIDIHLASLEIEETRVACEALRAAWGKSVFVDAYPEVLDWLESHTS